MLFSQLSPTGRALQLPGMVVGHNSSEYFASINAFYGLALSASLYRNSQVFTGSDGYPQLELIPLTINAQNDILMFTTYTLTDVTTGAINPVTGKNADFLACSPAWVVKASELTFLSGVALNAARSIFSTSDTAPSQLATLLRSIPGQPNWLGSTNMAYSTGGFLLEYYGDVADAPSTYLYPDGATVVAVISILQGQNIGKIMVCAP